MGDKILDKECLVNLTVRELLLTWRSIDRFTRSAEYHKYTKPAKDDIVKLIGKIGVLLRKNKVFKEVR